MATIVINPKAKKQIPPPIKQVAPNGTIVWEVGKTYLTNDNRIVVLTVVQPNILRGHIEGDELTYFWETDGRFVAFSIQDPRSIRREWWPYWKEEEHWRNDGKVSYRLADNLSWWSFSYKQVEIKDPDFLQKVNKLYPTCQWRIEEWSFPLAGIRRLLPS